MNKKELLIQGDVMLKRVNKPAELRPAGEGAEILALGETSGHGHVLENCDVMIGADEARYVIPRKDAKTEARLLHKHLTSDRPADHRELILPDLKPDEAFLVIIQNEFNAFKKVMEKVID
jgi:hypothetical protein